MLTDQGYPSIEEKIPNTAIQSTGEQTLHGKGVHREAKVHLAAPGVAGEDLCFRVNRGGDTPLWVSITVLYRERFLLYVMSEKTYAA